jgi:hypothetical protein
MIKILMKPKVLLGVCGLSLISLFSISMMNNSIMQKHSKLQTMNGGVGVCFQRITQTFTALMIKDLSSSYLSESFKNVTGDCFSDLTSSMKNLMAENEQALNATNNLTSDLHWFNSKIDKIISLNKGESLDLSESNIIKKYEGLEELKIDIEQQVNEEIVSFDSVKNLGLAGILLSQLALLFSLASLFFKQRVSLKELSMIESFSLDAIESNSKSSKAQRIYESLFSHIDLPTTKKFLMDYHTNLLEENYNLNDQIIKMNTIGFTEEITPTMPISNDATQKEEEVTNFTDSLNTVLDRIQEKAFTHGVMLDTDLGESFDVLSNSEALDQVLFNTIQFSMESSLGHNEGRRVIIRSKPLGGIAYCKIKILGHSFSDAEMNVINGRKVDDKINVNVNLVLLKELMDDANATIAVKNIHDQKSGQVESELEIIFERAQTKNTVKAPNVSVIKGTKKEIKKYFEQSM